MRRRYSVKPNGGHGIRYHIWIQKIIRSGNQGAIRVKYADILDNLAPGRQTDETQALVTKYLRARARIRRQVPYQVVADITTADIYQRPLLAALKTFDIHV